LTSKIFLVILFFFLLFLSIAIMQNLEEKGKEKEIINSKIIVKEKNFEKEISNNIFKVEKLLKEEKKDIIEEKEEKENNTYTGIASWYGDFFHGRKTANGERFNKYALTAAHKNLPFNTKVKVTNLHNNKSVIVRINDRGPFIDGRIIDLSMNAAEKIGMKNSGIEKVKIEIL